MNADRRAFERVPIHLAVAYERVNAFIADFANNISRGGTFVRTDTPLRPGTRLIFALSVPGESEVLELVGEVARVVPVQDATSNCPAGMGIRFLFPSVDDRVRAQAFFEKVLASELGPANAERMLSGIPGRR